MVSDADRTERGAGARPAGRGRGRGADRAGGASRAERARSAAALAEAPRKPRLDRNNGPGLTTTVGRIREDKVLRNGIKYVLVSHNTRMGAAEGAVLLAEWLKAEDYIS